MSRVAARTATVISLLCLVCSSGCGDPTAQQAPQLEPGLADPTDAGLVAVGEAVYLAHCASCHGTRLEGQPNWQEALPDGGYPAPPHDGSGHTWRHSDRQLFAATRSGGGFSAAPGSVSHMPAFESVLSDDEIWAAIAFVKSRWPVELLARQRLLTRMRSQRPDADHGGHTGHEGHTGHTGDPAQ